MDRQQLGDLVFQLEQSQLQIHDAVDAVRVIAGHIGKDAGGDALPLIANGLAAEQDKLDKLVGEFMTLRRMSEPHLVG